MRSIRLSLLVYFLALFTLTLGGALLFAYRTAGRTLEAKEGATRALIEAQYEERTREMRQRLDDRLLSQAKALAGRVRPRARWDRVNRGHYHLQSLGLLTSQAAPGGYVLAPLWALQGAVQRGGPRPRWGPPMAQAHFVIVRHDLIDLSLGKEVALPEDSPLIVYRIQTNNWGRAIPSPDGGLPPLPDESGYAATERLTWSFDDYLLGEVPVRRVRFRALLNLQDAPPGPPVPRPGYRPPAPALIIQCAAPARDREVSDVFRQVRDEEITSLREESVAALRRHRTRLLLIGVFTLAATVLGTFGLVRLGLRPLQRLSDAVSKVSPRDFRLRLDGAHMPAELRPIEDRLAETLDLLKRAFAREKQATADISHELRTPLAAMLTTIELALRRPRAPEQYREFLTDCRSSAKAMNQIVERLLTLARLDAGVDRLKPQAVDVGELAEQCATVVRPLAEARGLKLAVYHPEAEAEKKQGDARLTTDPDKLREVLNNLLHNAIQYNRPEGRIDVTVGRSNGHVELSVRDTGIGIPAQARDLIFERFYRADPSRTGDGLNAGLGLAIVKEYVELMGGRIRVESEEGRGSTFRIELPVELTAKVPA